MIRATFSAGATAITVNGLHQWDYGQKLEIAHPDLPAALEVHFATVGSREAIVRVVAGVNGVATVSIPDALLEQKQPILAWVYVVGETSGTTTLTVTMPVTARARPTAATPVPEEVSDKYTEALAAMNTQVAALKDGNVKVANAVKADSATNADNATAALSASSALFATRDGTGKIIHATYINGAADHVQGAKLPATGLYHLWVYYAAAGATIPSTKIDFGMIYFDGSAVVHKASGYISGSAIKQVHLQIALDGTMTVTGDDGGGGASWYYYKQLWGATATAETREEG